MEEDLTRVEEPTSWPAVHASVQERIRIRCTALDILKETEIESLAAGSSEEVDAMLHLLVDTSFDFWAGGKEGLECYADDEGFRLMKAWKTHAIRATEPVQEVLPRYPSESITQQELEGLAHAPPAQQFTTFKQLQLTLSKLDRWNAVKRRDALAIKVMEVVNMLLGCKAGPAGLPVHVTPYRLRNVVQQLLLQCEEAPHSPTTCFNSTGSRSTGSSPAGSYSPPQQDTPSQGSSVDLSRTPHHQDPAAVSRGCAPSLPAGAVGGDGVAPTLQEQVRIRCKNLEILTQADIEALAAGPFEEVEAVLQLLVEVEYDSDVKRKKGLVHYMSHECVRLVEAWKNHPNRATEPAQEVPQRYPPESITEQEVEEIRVIEAQGGECPAVKEIALALMKLYHCRAVEREVALADRVFGSCNMPLIPLPGV